VTKRVALLDTGPLVSFLAEGLVHHAWAVEQWKQLRPPLLTCEPVLTESAFLLKREGRDTDVLFALLERGIIRIGLAVEDQQADLRAAHAPLPQSADGIGRRMSGSTV
jgi:predicted nucleic acid-binding protein